jgi:hypothetical protein
MTPKLAHLFIEGIKINLSECCDGGTGKKKNFGPNHYFARRARDVESIMAGHAFYHTSSMHQEGTTVEKIGQKYFGWAHHLHQNY